MNGSRNKNGTWIMWSVELNRNIWYIFQEHDTNRIYLAIARKMRSSHDAVTLGIHLGINRHDVMYYSTNHDVRDAAYKFLCWAEDNYGPVKKWQKIIEALTVIGKNTIIIELELENRLDTAMRKVSVIGEGKNGNCFK